MKGDILPHGPVLDALRATPVGVCFSTTKHSFVGDKWRGYEVRLDCVSVAEIPDCDCPHWWFHDIDDPERVWPVVIVRITAGRTGDPVKVVGEWDGERFTIKMVGLEAVARPSEARPALEALALVKDVARLGRPTGTGTFENREAFIAVFAPTVQELRRKRQNPTAGNVLKALRTKLGRVDRAQLTRWHQRFGWTTWRAFLNDVK